MKKNRAFTGLEIIAVLALLGVGTWFVAPKIFPGASKRAQTSVQTTQELVAAKDAPAAANAASLTVINRALASVPDSPSTRFIANEVPIMLARSPAPDPMELVAAEKRRVAFLEGQLDEQRRLTAVAMKGSVEQVARITKAELAKQASDQALVESAAAEHARTVQLAVAAIIALLAATGWVWLKFNSVSIPNIGKLAADLRSGADPIAALSSIVDVRLHDKVQGFAKQETPLK
jgi:hypothetical protein